LRSEGDRVGGTRSQRVALRDHGQRTEHMKRKYMGGIHGVAEISLQVVEIGALLI